MILNVYELLMTLAQNGSGLIRMYGYSHPLPKHRKFIPLPWADVWGVGLLIERGATPQLWCEPWLTVNWP